jgi:hypothetical protein
MRNATTHTRVIGAFALVLATAALLAPAAVGKPTPRDYGQPNLQGSQLDRLVPQPPASVPDAFERALIRTEEESSRALRDVYSDRVQANAVYPDAFERAVARHEQTEYADWNAYQNVIGQAVAQRRAEVAAGSLQSTSSGDGGSFDWGLLVTLCAIAAGCLAVGAVAITSVKERRRISTP